MVISIISWIHKPIIWDITIKYNVSKIAKLVFNSNNYGLWYL
jgi:hypothetical protein